MKITTLVDSAAWVGQMRERFFKQILAQYPGIPRADAEDIAQQAAQELWKGIEQEAEIYTDPLKWAYGILRNTINGWYFRGKKKDKSTVGLEALGPHEPRVLAFDEDRRRLLREAARHLSATHQAILRLRRHGYKHEEIAARLGVTAATVRKETTRIIELLKAKLASRI